MPTLEQPLPLRLPARQTFNQRNVDACFSCAIATTLEARGLEVPALSAAFHLYRATGGAAATGGMTLETARLVQGQYGICRQNKYDHDIGAGTPTVSPDPDAEADARRRRTLADADGNRTFRRLPGANRPAEWRAALAQKLPVLIRLWLNNGYRALEQNHDNPTWTDTTQGDRNHAVVVIGHEPAQLRFVVQDSRGSDFALQGQWFLPEAQAVLGPITDAYVLTIPLQRLL